MIVIDAGVVVDLVIGVVDPACLSDEELAVPHLIDSEVTNALRLLARRRALTEKQADLAFDGFSQLVLSRFPAEPLRRRMWELRGNLSAYDATYVALAEALGATALLTTDARLAAAPGINCLVKVV
ncbi:type II toxin-antitoxin system VapC family toxin [Nocardia sp. NPDC058658]|uniref:type II toxin-antitoxin system VapC family toxin n=1 Tax=Nocardia sp. NPDC058658 TaxID=3346580 RepID=UPI0036627161